VTAALALLASVFGLVLGSFANVAIHRMPVDRSVIRPRSHCPRCRRVLRPWELLPLLSWLALRARCATCRAPISVRYPLVELLCGLLAWLLWRRFVPDGSPDPAEALAWLAFTAWATALVIGSLVDVRHHLLPDETTIPWVPLGVAVMAVLGTLGHDGWGGVGWRSSVLGAAAGGGSFALLAFAARQISGREALGAGDVKLTAAIGAWVGVFPGLLVAVQVGALVGSAWGILHWATSGRRSLMPFGPSLAVGALLWVLYGDALLATFAPRWPASIMR
jgi:leader peptidase (prepilin peptidase)/N-methyltransferase